MKAVLDACVLYPTVLRQILTGVAGGGLIAPIWSDRLLEEWARTAARRGGAAEEAEARGQIAVLNAQFPDALTATDPGAEAALWLPDAGDVHVLSTAIAAGADRIVTLNLKDFPRRELAAHGVTADHPDAVLYGLWLDHPGVIEGVVADTHRAFEAARGAPADLRPLLKRARLPRLGKAVSL